MVEYDTVLALFEAMLGRTPKDDAVQALSTLDSEYAILQNLACSKEFAQQRESGFLENDALSDNAANLLAQARLIGSKEAVLGRTRGDVFTEVLTPWYLAELEQAGLRFIQSKSLPRSGHHFLVLLLQRYFGLELKYCERYTLDECCHQIPCVMIAPGPNGPKYMLQKSHDFQLEDQKFSAMTFVIQHRALVPRVQSNFEMALTHVSSVTDSAQSFREFFERELEYTIGFYRKWCASDQLDKIVLAYEDLVEQPQASFERVVKFITDQAPDVEKLEYALRIKEMKVGAHNSPKGIREPKEHRFFDYAYCREMEGRLREACPEIPVRYFFL